MAAYDATMMEDGLAVYHVDGDLTQFAFDRLYTDVVNGSASGITVGVEPGDDVLDGFAYIESVDDAAGPQCGHAYVAERTADGYDITRFTDGERSPALRLVGAGTFFMTDGVAELEPVVADEDPITLAERVYDTVDTLRSNQYLAREALDDIADTQLGGLSPGQFDFLGHLTGRTGMSLTEDAPAADTVVEQQDVDRLMAALEEHEAEIPFSTLLRTGVVDRVPLPYGAPEGLDAPDETIGDVRQRIAAEGSYDSPDEGAA